MRPWQCSPLLKGCSCVLLLAGDVRRDGRRDCVKCEDFSKNLSRKHPSKKKHYFLPNIVRQQGIVLARKSYLRRARRQRGTLVMSEKSRDPVEAADLLEVRTRPAADAGVIPHRHLPTLPNPHISDRARRRTMSSRSLSSRSGMPQSKMPMTQTCGKTAGKTTKTPPNSSSNCGLSSKQRRAPPHQLG